MFQMRAAAAGLLAANYSTPAPRLRLLQFLQSWRLALTSLRCSLQSRRQCKRLFLHVHSQHLRWTSYERGCETSRDWDRSTSSLSFQAQRASGFHALASDVKASARQDIRTRDETTISVRARAVRHQLCACACDHSVHYGNSTLATRCRL